MHNTLLIQDGATTENEERLLVVGATNRPQELDEAARRRLVKKLYIPLPDHQVTTYVALPVYRFSACCFCAKLVFLVIFMSAGSHTLSMLICASFTSADHHSARGSIPMRHALLLHTASCWLVFMPTRSTSSALILRIWLPSSHYPSGAERLRESEPWFRLSLPSALREEVHSPPWTMVMAALWSDMEKL